MFTLAAAIFSKTVNSRVPVPLDYLPSTGHPLPQYSREFFSFSRVFVV